MHDNHFLKSYKNIIWDWNGTLLNDNWLCVEIVNKLLENHNDRQLDVNSYKEVFGFPIVDYYRRIGMDLEKESFEELTIKFIADYELQVNNCQLQEGAVLTLNKFKELSKTQFILTAGHKESVMELLEHHTIEGFFKQIEGLDNHRAESKIDKGLKLIDNNAIVIEETVLIGDTIHDYEVANELGVHCILVANGHQSKPRLVHETNNVIPIYNSMYELSKNIIL